MVQPNKAVVGANAFAHASGIHQDGVLKARDTYEIMRAEDVGWTANKIVLGKLSGRNAFKQRLQELGIELESESEVNAAFGRFQELADQKAEIFDEDIMAIVSDEAHDVNEHYRFVSLSQRSETGERPHARVVFNMDGSEQTGEAEGNGPVDATMHAIEGKVNSGAELVLYSVNAITTGTQAQGEVTVRLSKAGRIVNGVGTDPDIVAASAKAYLAALEQAARQGRTEDQAADLIPDPRAGAGGPQGPANINRPSVAYPATTGGFSLDCDVSQAMRVSDDRSGRTADRA